LVPLEIPVRNDVHSEIIIMRTLFPTVILLETVMEPRETIFLRISCYKNRLTVEIREVKNVPLKINVKNEVPRKNILPGTLVLTVISRGT
jgi:hypothetical protein